MKFLDVLKDSFIDTAKVLPILFIVYYLIELLEYKNAIKLQTNKMLKGGASPLVGSVIGCVPQCGFSVVMSDLFSKKSVSIGALIAVFISTSDEALPLMFANPKALPWLALLLGLKIVFAISVGYLSMLLYKLFFKNSKKDSHTHINEEIHTHEETHTHENTSEHEEHKEVEITNACCHHHVIQRSFDWVHPLTHCLKICLFIFIINIVFGSIVELWIGEQALVSFLNKSKFLQPIFAVLLGLIPNCASSVVLTEMFLLKGISFGALFAGLSVNAGLGIIVLFKENKNWKENLFIVSMLIISSLVIGYALLFI